MKETSCRRAGQQRGRSDACAVWSGCNKDRGHVSHSTRRSNRNRLLTSGNATSGRAGHQGIKPRDHDEQAMSERSTISTINVAASSIAIVLGRSVNVHAIGSARSSSAAPKGSLQPGARRARAGGGGRHTTQEARAGSQARPSGPGGRGRWAPKQGALP